MKKALTAILAVAILALPMKVKADAAKPYCSLLYSAETPYNTTVFKCEGEKGTIVPAGAIEYTELNTKNGWGAALVKRAMDYNGDGIFNGKDYYMDAETKESNGKDAFKGQNILNELKKYFLKPLLC